MGGLSDAFTVVLVVVALSTAFGLWRRMSDGKIKNIQAPPARPQAQHERLTASDIGAPLGERATFVQFSSAFCQPCRATKLLLENVTHDLADVSHIEIDAESNLELVRRLDILRTPTVVVLDAAGNIRGKASGVPRRDHIMKTLDSL